MDISFNVLLWVYALMHTWGYLYFNLEDNTTTTIEEPAALLFFFMCFSI